MATVETYSTAGTFSWTAPNTSSVQVQCWGGGGGGDTNATGGGAAGGGGAYSIKNSYAVTPGNSYTVVVGVAGAVEGNGGDTYFVDTSTVLAKGGTGATSKTANGVGGAAGSGVGDTKYSGGDGGDGGTAGGAGGGSSAGTGANGANGTNGGTTAGGAGGTAPSGGGNGGAGGSWGGAAAVAGSAPGGAGGGSALGAVGKTGAAGKTVLTYTATPIEKNFTDSMTFIDSLTKQPTLVKTESFALVDATPAKYFVWEKTETMALADTSLKSLNRSISDIFTIIDSTLMYVPTDTPRLKVKSMEVRASAKTED